MNKSPPLPSTLLLPVPPLTGQRKQECAPSAERFKFCHVEKIWDAGGRQRRNNGQIKLTGEDLPVSPHKLSPRCERRKRGGKEVCSCMYRLLTSPSLCWVWQRGLYYKFAQLCQHGPLQLWELCCSQHANGRRGILGGGNQTPTVPRGSLHFAWRSLNSSWYQYRWSDAGLSVGKCAIQRSQGHTAHHKGDLGLTEFAGELGTMHTCCCCCCRRCIMFMVQSVSFCSRW